MGQIAVTDAQIQQEYDAHKTAYVIPEKRDIQQIEFKTEKEAADARAQIDKGMSFDELASHRGLKPDQMSLGTLTQADLPDPDRAKAIFALPENQVSQPLKTALGGYVLARVTKITPGSNKTLADVKDDIKKTLSRRAGRQQAGGCGQRLYRCAFRRQRPQGSRQKGRDEAGPPGCGGRERPQARRQQGGRAGRSGILCPRCSRPKWAKTAIPPPPRPATISSLHVNGVTPPKLKPLDQVRAQAIVDWTNEQRGKLLAAKALSLAAQAEKDKSLDNVAKDLKVSVQHSPALTPPDQ